LLSECVLEPRFADEEIEEQVEAASIELEEFFTKPDVLLREVLPKFIFNILTVS
jgi:hypothetical protein